MSIQLNFSSHQEYELIEYPGMVKNVDKMLTTLGGIKKVSQVLGGEQKRLELHFHPDNPFNKAAFGDSNRSAGLLLSVKVRRSKRDPTRQPKYEVRILGHCSKVYTFESLCDFQYLPLSKKNDTGQFGFELVKLMPKSAIDTEYFDTTDVQLMCMPQMFSRTDTIHTTIFRSDIQDDDNGQSEVLGVLQKHTYDTRDTLVFNMIDPFPTKPDPQIVKRMKVKSVSDEQWGRVRKLFEDCPIWTRIALLYESGVSNEKLKCITSSLAYYFSTGPWRTLYVRYGYDPRKDFNSRYYQTFDFRLRFRSGVAEFVSNRRDTIKKKQESPYELNELVQDIDYPYFEENKLPRSRQCILRYCDIRMPKIQEMLEKIPSPLTGAMCNERTGWLPAGFDGQVRQIVSNAIKELLRSHYRKEQIHAEVDSVDNTEQPGADNDDDDDEDDDADDVEVGDNDFDTNDANDFLNESIEGILDDMEVDNEELS